jgi:hypothetical protein
MTILSRVGVGVLDWMIGFVDALYTSLRTTINDLKTLQFTITHISVLSLH